MQIRNLMVAAAIGLTGCASEQLRFTSTRQMSSEPDIYIQQVMDNLSRIATDPTVLPYFNTLDSGVPQVTDKLTIGGLLMYPAQSLVKQLHNQRGGQLGPLTGERDVNLNWTIKPVNDEGRLRAMQGLYLWVLGRLDPAELCDSEKKIGSYYTGTNGKANFSFRQVEQGWFQCGRWQDKPKDARYCVHHHGTYCWVVPGHEKSLTDLSLRMLRIALVVKRTKTVVRTYYNVEGRVAQTESSVEAVEKIVRAGTVVRPSANAEKEREYRRILTANVPTVLWIVQKYEKLFHQLFSECDRQTFDTPGKTPEDVLKRKMSDPVYLTLLLSNDEIKNLIKTVRTAPSAAKVEEARKKLEQQRARVRNAKPKLDAIAVENDASVSNAMNEFSHAELEHSNAQAEVASQLDKIDEDIATLLDSSPDPELNIDTFTNTEISPGLITGAPH
jgi:hypothetical protein